MSTEYEKMNVEKWVNIEDVANHLSLSQDTVRIWIKEGKLPVYKAGKRYKFKISEVDVYPFHRVLAFHWFLNMRMAVEMSMPSISKMPETSSLGRRQFSVENA